MARRNKRASMREGPLADLFRSTAEDAPEDPPEAPRPGGSKSARYGREDPAEAKKGEAETTPVPAYNHKEPSIFRATMSFLPSPL